MQSPPGRTPRTAQPWADAASTMPLAVDRNGRLEVDLPCIECNYNLRGVDSDGYCPECGHPVHASHRADWLTFCDPTWLRSVAVGYRLIVIGAVMIAAMFTYWIAGALANALLVIPMLLFGVSLFAIGISDVGQPEPSGAVREKRLTPRLLVRVSPLLLLVTAGLPFVISALDISHWTGGACDGLALTVALMVTCLTLMPMVTLWHSQSLARRLPSQGLSRATRLAIYLLLAAIVLWNLSALNYERLGLDHEWVSRALLWGITAVTISGWTLALVLCLGYARALKNQAQRARSMRTAR